MSEPQDSIRKSVLPVLPTVLEDEYDFQLMVFNPNINGLLPHIPLLIRAVRRMITGYQGNNNQIVYVARDYNLTTEDIRTQQGQPIPAQPYGANIPHIRYLRITPGFAYPNHWTPTRGEFSIHHPDWPPTPDDPGSNAYLSFCGFGENSNTDWFSQLIGLMQKRVGYINGSKNLDHCMLHGYNATKIELDYQEQNEIIAGLYRAIDDHVRTLPDEIEIATSDTDELEIQQQPIGPETRKRRAQPSTSTSAAPMETQPPVRKPRTKKVRQNKSYFIDHDEDGFGYVKFDGRRSDIQINTFSQPFCTRYLTARKPP